MKKFVKYLWMLAALLLLSQENYGQMKCAQKRYCADELYGDYDYRSQSQYTKMQSGDTTTTNIIAYSGQQMRILVCADEKLGAVNFRIFRMAKRPQRAIKLISGNDTIWEVKMIPEKQLVFESYSSGELFWDKNIKKTTNLIIETTAEIGRRSAPVCVNILVGRKE